MLSEELISSNHTPVLYPISARLVQQGAAAAGSNGTPPGTMLNRDASVNIGQAVGAAERSGYVHSTIPPAAPF